MDLTSLKGIGPKKASDLKRLGIVSVSDLYSYYPKEYEDRTRLRSIIDIKDSNKHYFCWQIVSKLYFKNLQKMTISYLYARELTNPSYKIRLIWFNDRFSPRKLFKGKEYKFFTQISDKQGIYEAINPIFCDLDEDEIGSIIPLYSLTKGLSHKQISTFVEEALKYYDSKEEIIDDSLLDKFKLNKRIDNLREIHRPTSIENLSKAKSQVKIIDLLKDLYFLDYLKEKTRHKQSINLHYNLGEILKEIPFTLTRSQEKSLIEILEDVASPNSANRLLVGDVGSGKTIVAIITMIVFALNSYQSAMMVPTELLAIQQFEKNKYLFDKFKIKAALLTSSTKNKQKLKEDIRDGKIDLLIGTHALIQEDVVFKNLRFVVNDEQHRFGVSQRQMLALKGNEVNYLTMTATPIPRTMSLKISQIIDLSIINELPKGRVPITTKIIGSEKITLLYDFIVENIRASRQVYVVTNNIDADDKNSLENLYKLYKKKFPSYRIAILHGKLTANDKEDILKEFSEGRIDILLATTVIEVGIDVANANTMIIYNADNFGLSTLHQLRGRVGRGEYKSYCFLVSDKPSPASKLNILVKSNDGFEIAKKDFDLRGGGKILSLIQHGKNLSKIEYLNMTAEEIDKSFEIYKKTKDSNFKGVNFYFIDEFFCKDKRIILN